MFQNATAHNQNTASQSPPCNINILCTYLDLVGEHENLPMQAFIVCKRFVPVDLAFSKLPFQQNSMALYFSDMAHHMRVLRIDLIHLHNQMGIR